MVDTYFEDNTHKTAIDGDEAIPATSDPGGSPADVYFTPNDLAAYLSAAWIAVSDTWSYATANTFTVSGDKTDTLRRGVKIKLTQTTVKYLSVVSSTYGAPNTTVTVTGGSDYALVNAAITSPFYSNAETPQGFPVLFSWTPTFTGFSADPTGTHKFRVLPHGLYVDVQHSANGTSNANTFYISTPPGVTLPASIVMGPLAFAIDNDAASTTKDDVRSDGTGAIYQMAKAASTTGWTTSAGKRCRFTLVHSLP